MARMLQAILGARLLRRNTAPRHLQRQVTTAWIRN
jgi:hypothetical protein